MIVQEEDYINCLKHSGVKGMHWHHHKVKELSPGIPKGANVVKLKDYKGPIYFVSEVNMNAKTLSPRVPSNYFTKNRYEDGVTPRVCFAPSVDQCIMALSLKATNHKYYVHSPDKSIEHDVYKPNDKAVPDSKITDELWIKEPVKLKLVGEILVIGDKGNDGLPFKYGDKTAELYEWDYKWTKEHT